MHDAVAELRAAADLEQMLMASMGAALSITDHPVLRSMIEHEPDLVLPHVSFNRLDHVFDQAAGLLGPHLGRFLPPGEIRPAVELLVRVVASLTLRPADWVDPHDPASVRRLVRTYLVPALSARPSPTGPDRSPSPEESAP